MRRRSSRSSAREHLPFSGESSLPFFKARVPLLGRSALRVVLDVSPLAPTLLSDHKEPFFFFPRVFFFPGSSTRLYLIAFASSLSPPSPRLKRFFPLFFLKKIAWRLFDSGLQPMLSFLSFCWGSRRPFAEVATDSSLGVRSRTCAGWKTLFHFFSPPKSLLRVATALSFPWRGFDGFPLYLYVASFFFKIFPLLYRTAKKFPSADFMLCTS